MNICEFSSDEKHRFTLWRDFEDPYPPNEYSPSKHLNGYVMFIGLNPSTADETHDDPTIRKCRGFAKRWGYRKMCMTNLFSLRATDPHQLKTQIASMPENPCWLQVIAQDAALIVVAWGKHGGYHRQDFAVSKILLAGYPMKCLKLNEDGSPTHPLYVPYDILLQDYT